MNTMRIKHPRGFIEGETLYWTISWSFSVIFFFQRYILFLSPNRSARQTRQFKFTIKGAALYIQTSVWLWFFCLPPVMLPFVWLCLKLPDFSFKKERNLHLPGSSCFFMCWWSQKRLESVNRSAISCSFSVVFPILPSCPLCHPSVLIPLCLLLWCK